MNTTEKKIDELNSQVTLEISHDDYAESEKKHLSKYKKNAEFKGFRKGMVPMSLIQKVYGEQALVEAVNGCISEALDKFIHDNNFRMIGEPLASEDQPKVEWKSGNDFTFKFDLAQTPELTFVPSKDDVVSEYEITVSDEAKKEMKANMLRQLGDLQEAEKAGEEDYVIADLSNGEKTVEGAYVAVRSVAGDAHSKFLGAKASDEFDINVNDAFVNESDRAAMLKVKKDELASVAPEFHVKVVNVKTFVSAEENQETYDKLFGEDKVHNAEEFDKAVNDRLVYNYRQETDYKVSQDIRKYFVAKADIKLPEAFLKRWLLRINEGKFTAEDIDKDFDAFLGDYRWQMVRDHLMDMYKIKVEDKDMQEAAEGYVSYQYAMYGMGNVPETMIKEGAKTLLQDERQSANLLGSVQDTKVISEVRKNITLKPEKVSVEQFRELK